MAAIEPILSKPCVDQACLVVLGQRAQELRQISDSAILNVSLLPWWKARRRIDCRSR